MVLVGLPGSGKSTYVQGRPALSSDEIRRLISDDSDNQKIHALVFKVLRALLKVRLELKRPLTYIDATNLSVKERRPYIKIAQLHGCDIEAIFFDVPVKECQRRNRKRVRVVPDRVIEGMSKRLAAPSIDEGFRRVKRAVR